MHDGFLEQPHQQRQAVGSAAGQKGRPTRQHEFQRIQGGFDTAPGCGAALESHKRRRAVLKGGQAVGAVVMDDDGDIDVSLGSKDQVFKSFSVRIAVAGEADDLQSRLRDFYSLGYGKGSAVDAIETVDVEIIHDLCMTADPRDDHDILQREGPCPSIRSRPFLCRSGLRNCRIPDTMCSGNRYPDWSGSSDRLLYA